MEALTRDVEYLVTHRESMGTGYLYPDLSQPRINLDFFARDDTRYADTTAQQFFDLDQDIPLASDEFVYGISVVSNYGRD